MAHLTPDQQARFVSERRTALKLAGDAGRKVQSAANYLSIIFPVLGLISLFKPGAKDIKAFRINKESGEELLWRSAELREMMGYGAPTQQSLDRIHTAQDALLVSGDRPRVTSEILSYWAAGKPADFTLDLGAVRREYYGGIDLGLYGGRLPYFLGGQQAPPGLRPGEKTLEELGLGKWFTPGPQVPIGFSLGIGGFPAPPVAPPPPVVTTPTTITPDAPVVTGGGPLGVTTPLPTPVTDTSVLQPIQYTPPPGTWTPYYPSVGVGQPTQQPFTFPILRTSQDARNQFISGLTGSAYQPTSGVQYFTPNRPKWRYVNGRWRLVYPTPPPEPRTARGIWI